MSVEERLAIDVAPLCPHGFADPVACEDCSPSEETDQEALALARMRIPAGLQGARLWNWEPADGVPRKACEEYVSAWPPARPFLWLGGNIGTGKSHLAAAILFTARERWGVYGQFWSVSEVADSYRAASSPEYEGPWPAGALDVALKETPLLVLDDLGRERVTGFSEARLFAVVDARYREQRPTVVTTNAGAEDIEPALRSRLLSGIEVRFTGRDRRMQ